MKPLFNLGQTVMTRGVAESINQVVLLSYLARHAAGDWGDVGVEDGAENDWALNNGQRLLSAYTVGDHRIWIITEWDRSVTTVLFPEEY